MLYSSIAANGDIIDLVSNVLGDEPFLLKDKLIYKLGGDAGYRLHQDLPYLDVPESMGPNVTIVAIPIDPITPDNGGVRFFLGCHDVVHPTSTPTSGEINPQDLAQYRQKNVFPSGGALILFHPLTPHDSGPNRSSEARRVLYFTYTSKRYASLRNDYYRQRGEKMTSQPNA